MFSRSWEQRFTQAGVNGPGITFPANCQKLSRVCLIHISISGPGMEDDASEGKAHTTFERLGDLKKWQESLFSLDLFQEPTDDQEKAEAWAEQKYSSMVYLRKATLNYH